MKGRMGGFGIYFLSSKHSGVKAERPKVRIKYKKTGNYIKKLIV
jgi:hypothetical protein